MTDFARRALLLATLAALTGCGERTEAPREAEKRPAVSVAIGAVSTVGWPEWYDVGGVVRARTTATVSSRILAPVLRVGVVVGDRVGAGQLLVQLDEREARARAEAARMAIDVAERAAHVARADREAAEVARGLAEATLGRVQRLHDRKSATPQELDEATAALSAARARLTSVAASIDQAEAGLASARATAEVASVAATYGRLVAPFDGRIVEKLVEVGDTATPGAPLVRLESLEGFHVETRLDEARIGLVALRMAVGVTLADAMPAQSVPGTIVEIARLVEDDSRSFLVKVALGRDGGRGPLRSGMFARVRLRGAPRQALVVPTSALVMRGQVATVFVAENGVARVRLVQLGDADGESIEVLSGLDAGERVVLSPPTSLRDLDPVVVPSASVDLGAGGRREARR